MWPLSPPLGCKYQNNQNNRHTRAHLEHQLAFAEVAGVESVADEEAGQFRRDHLWEEVGVERGSATHPRYPNTVGEGFRGG
jgi:hypothetical protein